MCSASSQTNTATSSGMILTVEWKNGLQVWIQFSADIASLYATESNILNMTIRGLLMAYVKFVLKLFQTYITSDYFLYLCNVLTSIAIPEANSSQQGCRQNRVYSETFKIIEDMDLFLVETLSCTISSMVLPGKEVF